MLFEILASFAITDWFADATYEFVRYFNHMNTTQWGIVSAAAVLFGFLCLKGHSING